jgi:hypothetical protein
MREMMESRRSDLAAELERGERVLAEMNARQGELRANLLRISGAMQMLDELLAAETPNEPHLQRAAS